MFVTLLIASFQSKSQEFEGNKYGFANFDRNRIDIYGSGTNMKFFFYKLEKVLTKGQGKVTVMHIGGSHVQADMMTHEFRSRLLALKPNIDGGRGMIFPFSAGNTNNPVSYRTEYTGEWKYERSSYGPMTTDLGLIGASITTSDTTASIKIKLESVMIPNTTLPNFHFNKLKVLGYSEGKTVLPVVTINNTKYFPMYDRESGCYAYKLPFECSEFGISFIWPNSKSTFTLTGIIVENDVSGIICHNIGVNGASLESYLKCPNLERDLRLVRPDLVILCIGINDAFEDGFSETAFIKNYIKLISVIRSVNPNCALLFVSNNDSFIKDNDGNYVVNERGIVVEKAMKNLAKQYSSGFFDLFDIMGGLGSMAQWENAGLARHDKVHFTVTGYKVIGDLLFDALYDKYSQFIDWKR